MIPPPLCIDGIGQMQQDIINNKLKGIITEVVQGLGSGLEKNIIRLSEIFGENEKDGYENYCKDFTTDHCHPND